MLKALFILCMTMLFVSQPQAVMAGTTGPGDHMLVGLANDSPTNYNCARDDVGQCLMPLLPETGGDLSARVYARDAEIAGRATNHGVATGTDLSTMVHKVVNADYYDERGTSFLVICIGAGLGLCVLAALMLRQRRLAAAQTAMRSLRRRRRH